MSVVIDASVTLAWCFQDETTPFTAAVFRRVEDRGAVVPSIWPLEVANSVLMGRRRNRLSSDEASTFLALLSALPVRVDFISVLDIWSATVGLADAQQITVYDATYLELAIRESLPLATLDRRLQDAARRIGLEVLEPGGSLGSPGTSDTENTTS